MFYEVRKVRQHDGEQQRRWFTCETADLYVWTDSSGISAFELCYNKLVDEHVLTWRRGQGMKHARIDDGEQNIFQKRTPIAGKDGALDLAYLAMHFEELAAHVDPSVYRFILATLYRNGA